MSCGWFTRSASYASVPRWQLVRGKVTAATTYPALAQACSRSEYAPGHCRNPGANNSSGNGPAGPRARGYQIWVTSVRWPRCWPAGPVWAGSVNVTCRSPVR